MTYEMKSSTRQIRDQLRKKGYRVENLGDGFWNVEVLDTDSDNLTDLLEELDVDFRLV